MILSHLMSYHIHIKLKAAGSPGVCFSLITRHNVSADQLNWNLTSCWEDKNTLAKGNTKTSILLVSRAWFGSDAPDALSDIALTFVQSWSQLVYWVLRPQKLGLCL